MAGLVYNTSKLRDDLKKSEETFNIDSYLTANEASKYLSELPGLKDIISAVQGFVDKAFEFADMILDFLNKILSWLDLNKILDSLGIKALFEFLVDTISDGLTAIGYPIGIRAILNNIFRSVCMQLSDNIGYDRNKIEQFSLISLIIMLSCTIGKGAYVTFYTMVSNTPDIVLIRETIEELESDYYIASNNPSLVFNNVTQEYEVDTAELTNRLNGIQSKIDIEKAKLLDRERKIDNLFASLGPLIITQVAVNPMYSVESVTGLIDDIANHHTASIIKNNNSNLAEPVLMAIEKSAIKSIDSTKSKTDTITKNEKHINPKVVNLINSMCDQNDINRNREYLKPTLHKLTLDRLLTSLSAIDNSVDTISLYKNNVIRTLALMELEQEPVKETDLVTNCTTLSNTMKYLV